MLLKSGRARKAHKTEAGEQIALVAWAWHQHKLLLVHTPNELMRFLNDGQKCYQIKMGTKVGWPDLMLCHVKPPYGALYIEMKSKTGKVSPEQEKWRNELLMRNYAYSICRSFEEGQRAIEDYIKN